MKKQIGKEKLFEKYINVPVYNCDIILLIGPKKLLSDWAHNPENIDRKHQDRLIAGIHGANEKGDQSGLCFHIKGGGCVIWLEEFSATTFIHEAAHAALYILKAKGITLCDETDEVYAYLLEYVWTKLNPFEFRRERPKKK